MVRTSRATASLALDSWQELVGPKEPALLQGPHLIQEFVQKLFAFESLQPPAPRASAAPDAEPYSLQWFLNLENQRHSKHGRWIPKLLEFAKHPGETLLALGDGLGTDWVQYAQQGAKVIVCGSAPDHLEIIRRNFQVRGLTGRFVHAEPTHLPLEAGMVDVACITHLPKGAQTAAAVKEVYRVLKPGGKVLAVVPAHYHVDRWARTLFFWRRWFAPQETVPALPGAKWTGRQLRALFHQFREHRIRKRQLRRAEVPVLWRVLPLPLLARLMGRFLILKTFKPIVPDH